MSGYLLAGETAWAPGLPVALGMQRVPIAGRTAGSAGPRRRFDPLQLEWVAPSGAPR